MSKVAQRFRARDVQRLIKSIRAAGLPVSDVEVGSDGRLIARIGAPADKDGDAAMITGAPGEADMQEIKL